MYSEGYQTSEDEEMVDEVDESPGEDTDVSDVEPSKASPSKRKGKGKLTEHDEDQHIIVQTAFDAYFTYTASRAQTSSNVFSQTVLPLTQEEYSDGIKSASKRLKPIHPSILNEDTLQTHFSRFLCELNEGFNVICYGLGSKRRMLNKFASEVCSKKGHVVIANGFQPDFTLKDLMNSVENIPQIQGLDMATTAVEKQATRIYNFFADPSQKQHLYIVLHSIDAAPLRTSRAKAVLGLLALNPRIHIIASVDHLNSPMLWSSSELLSRKPSNLNVDIPPARGFAWLWHDLTTLAQYELETAFADRSSISGAHGSGARRKTDALASQNATAMSETAASHILASVTQKARKLFTLLGNKQLESIDEAGDKATNDLQQYGMAYDVLLNAAREEFLAINDTALRSLLGEFRDHGLVVSAQSGTGGGEVLWIPLRKERLSSVLELLLLPNPSS